MKYTSVKLTTVVMQIMSWMETPPSIVRRRESGVIQQQCVWVSDPVCVNPFKPEFTIVIFIHHKPRIAVAILDL